MPEGNTLSFLTLPDCLWGTPYLPLPCLIAPGEHPISFKLSVPPASDHTNVLPLQCLHLVVFQLVKLPQEVFPTDMHWFPRISGNKKQSQSELFVLTATDGEFLFQKSLHKIAVLELVLLIIV